MILKDNQLVNINIKDNIENNYVDLSLYILRILQDLSNLNAEQIMDNPETTEILNNFVATLENF